MVVPTMAVGNLTAAVARTTAAEAVHPITADHTMAVVPTAAVVRTIVVNPIAAADRTMAVNPIPAVAHTKAADHMVGVVKQR